MGFVVSPVTAEESAFYQAWAAYESRDLETALRYAEEAVRKDPRHVDARVLLGELYYLRQDLTRAQEQWSRAAELAPSRKDVREMLDKLQRERTVENTLSRSDTHPFVLRFASGQVPVDLGSLKQMLRTAHRQIGQQFDYFPSHSITVLLYPKADFEKIKGLSHQVVGLYDGKIRLPLNPGRLTGGELERILWHEYTHAVVHDLSKGRCPLWLNEGIAQLQEARVSAIDLEEFRAAWKAGKLPSWDSLWSAEQYDPATLSLNYQTSYVAARYLVKRWGWQGMAALLGRLGQGYPVADALRAQYREEPPVIEQEWRNWIRRTPL